MRKVLLSQSNFFFLLIVGLCCLTVEASSCDTSIFFGDTSITCKSVSSKGDSIIISFEKGKIVSITKISCCGGEDTFTSFYLNGDTLTHSRHRGSLTIGLRRIFYPGHQPQRFTHFNDRGEKDGWEVFWYDNGNVKDSTLYRNGKAVKSKSFYYNGQVKIIEEEFRDKSKHNAVTYDIKGNKTGEIKNGTGSIYVCDSLGNNCHKIVYRDGEYIMRESD